MLGWLLKNPQEYERIPRDCHRLAHNLICNTAVKLIIVNTKKGLAFDLLSKTVPNFAGT